MGAAASVALIFVAGILAVVGGTGGSASQSQPTSTVIVDAAELAKTADELGHPLYWAGEKQGDRLELTNDGKGNVYLRYLPPGVEAGDSRTGFLTVGTYPIEEAQSALGDIAKRSGRPLIKLPGGAVALPNPSSKGSVYVAYPHSPLEVEVYAPKAREAERLIRNGLIVPVGG